MGEGVVSHHSVAWSRIFTSRRNRSEQIMSPQIGRPRMAGDLVGGHDGGANRRLVLAERSVLAEKVSAG